MGATPIIRIVRVHEIHHTLGGRHGLLLVDAVRGVVAYISLITDITADHCFFCGRSQNQYVCVLSVV